MKLPEQNKKRVIQGIAIMLPLLLITGGSLIWRAKRHTLSQSPQNLTQQGDASSASSQGGHNLDEQNAGAPVAKTASATQSTAPAGVGSVATNGSSEKGNATSGVTSGADSKSVATAEMNVAQTPSEMKDGCFTLTFKHKPMATHSSDDECSHHRNLIKLTRTDVHSSSVCIRVNGTPVRHEAVAGKADEFIIGAVAGPKDIVTARFCVGKAKCSEGCPYPKQEAAKKDEFLEAISGGSNDDSNVAQWEATDAQKNNEVNQALDGDLKKAVEEQELASQHTAAGNSKLAVFKDWISGDIALACGTHQANEGNRSTASVRVADSSELKKTSRKQ